MRGKLYKTLQASSRRRHRRTGAIMIWCALLLVVLTAMVGLVIDGGLLMASFRETQNAADSAAMAAAMDLMLGKTNSYATTTANTFVKDSAHNNLPTATVTVNIPPSEGPYAGKADYVETFVTLPVTTYFMQVVPGFNKNRTVKARAVAGFQPVAINAGVMTLNPTGTTLQTSGNALLKINGRIVVNSTNSNAASTSGNAAIYGNDIEVAGGVSNSKDFFDYSNPSGPSPLHTGATPTPDMFGHLPTPTSANGVGGSQTIPKNGQYQPGIYTQNIAISGNTKATFAPGIYVMAGSSLTLSGNGTITGTGVMFYFTGSDYTSSGSPDSSDPVDPLNASAPTDSKATFGSVSLSGNGAVTLSPITTAGSPFQGMMFYFRRANTNGVSITGNAALSNLTGTIYDKYGNLTLSGNGGQNAQFVVGSMSITGNGDVTVNYTGQNVGQAPEIFLVE